MEEVAIQVSVATGSRRPEADKLVLPCKLRFHVVQSLNTTSGDRLWSRRSPDDLGALAGADILRCTQHKPLVRDLE